MRAAIIGYGKSGKSAHELLSLGGYSDVDIYDANTKLGYKALTEYVDSYDITIVSPGIDLKKYINITGNIESEISLAYNKMKKSAKIIAITGTNGKSTTTHLTAQVLNNYGIKAIACGNIGTPYAEAVLDDSIDVFVLELSSFQIDLLRLFSADVVALTNVTQDHMDRYGNMDNYYSSKLRLLDFIDNDGLLVADDDEKIKSYADKHSFGKQFITDVEVSSDNRLDFGKFSVSLDSYGLFGKHNLINLAYALLLADKVAGFTGDVSTVVDGLTNMPHRTEIVGKYDGVTYINDSKGTNVDSVITALRSVTKPSFLMLGGRDKNSDYTPLASLINDNISEVCYFGEARDIIKSQLSPLISDVAQASFDTLEDAVIYCKDNACDGATVLLSPACTSFDEFNSFEHRGDMFREYVYRHAGRGQ